MKLQYKNACEIADSFGFHPVHFTGPLGRTGWTRDGRNVWWADDFRDENDARNFFSSLH